MDEWPRAGMIRMIFSGLEELEGKGIGSEDGGRRTEEEGKEIRG
jgi:hypothetical protein